MLMCLWVIREASQCGPDTLSDERERESAEFNAVKSTKYQFGSVALQRVRTKRALSRSKPRNKGRKVICESAAWSEHVWGFSGCLTHTPRGTRVWQIRPTIMGNVCGTPDRLHVTWLSSRTASYAPVTTAMPRGRSPPPFVTADPHPQLEN